ncbi:hypothetical protein HKD37_08G021478 [Glycine soja]
MYMNENHWIYDSIISKEVNINEEEPDVFENIDYSDAFNTSQVFATCDDVFYWVYSVVYDIGFVAMIMRSLNHALAKLFVGHPYVGRLSEVEKIIIGDMTKLMVKTKNILLTLKEHDVNNCTTMKQVHNVRYAYGSSIRGSNSEIQQLMKLLKRD